MDLKEKKSIWAQFAQAAEEHQVNITKAKYLPSQILHAISDGKDLKTILIMLGELYWRMTDDEIWFKTFKRFIDQKFNNL